MTHVWMCHVPRTNESYHTYEWVMPHTWMSHSHVTRMNGSCHKSESVTNLDFRNKSWEEASIRLCNTLQHTVTHCNTLQHLKTHCNTLQHSAARCNTVLECPDKLLEEAFIRLCNTLKHTATRCNALQHTATHCNTLQHTATHCNTLQHTATHCNILQPRLSKQVVGGGMYSSFLCWPI